MTDYVSELRRAVQGPDALSLRYFPQFIAISFPFLVIVESNTIANSSQLLDWMIVKALSLVGLASFYYFLRNRFLLRSDKTVHLTPLILLSGAGGVIQGTITAIAIRKIGLVDVSDFWVRPVAGFFIALSWLPINAVCMNAFYTFANQRQEMQAKVARLQQVRFDQSGLAVSIRKSIVQSISKELNLSREVAKEEFEKSLKIESSSEISSSLLRDFASTNLRELSHQLWKQSNLPVAKQIKKPSNLLEIYRLGLFLPPIDSLFFSLTCTTLIMPFALRNSPIGVAIGLTLAFFLTSFLSMALLSPIAVKFSSVTQRAYPLRIVLASGISLATFGISRHHFAPNIDQRNFLIGATAFIFMSGVGLLISLARPGLADQDEVVAALAANAAREKLAIGLAEVEIALISRQWAQYIHGSLQAQLLAIAALLECSSEKGDTRSREEAIESAHTLLGSDFSLKDELVVRDLQQESIFRCQPWGDLIDFEVNCLIRQDLPGVPIIKFGDAVEEAITNAVRHGKATAILIDLRLNDAGDLQCTFTDNGAGIPEDSVNGIGSAIFASITGGNWSRTNRTDGPGTVLQLVVPMST